MWASNDGVAFVEDRQGRGMNDNLTIEVGCMLMAGRECGLLKDSSIERMRQTWLDESTRASIWSSLRRSKLPSTPGFEMT
jgi:hypothetical protein